MDIIEIALKHHTSDLTTKAMALIALLKLSSRFPSCSEYVSMLICLFYYYLILIYTKPDCSLNGLCRRIKEIVVQYKGSLVLELQQRSIELNSIIAKHQNIRYKLQLLHWISPCSEKVFIYVCVWCTRTFE